MLHTTVRIADKILDVFLDNSTGDKFYSLTSIADFTGQPWLYTFKFFRTRVRIDTVRLDGKTYSLLPCEVASEYIMHVLLLGSPETKKVLLKFFAQSLKELAKAEFKRDEDAGYSS